MHKRQRQEGSVLIMMIGIAAVLAIMASGLVFILGNVSANTANQRTRTKAFDIAEGALDYGMQTLAASWPTPGTTTPPTFSLSSFETLGSSSATSSQFANSQEYPPPNAGLGPFAAVQFYDNTVNPGQSDGINTNSHIDANGDAKMWLVASGATGSQTATIQAEVNRTTYNTNFPRGLAVYTGGDLLSNGGGNNPKIVIENQGGATSVTGYVAGNLQAPSVFANTITKEVGPGQVPPLSSLGFTNDLVNQVIALAQSLGTYYDYTTGTPLPNWNSFNFSGVCVIRVPDGTNVPIGNTGDINSSSKPGILFILGPVGGSGNDITVDMGGNENFYGVLYTAGLVQSSHGTPAIHGMLVCQSTLNMKGTPAIDYNDAMIANLANQWTLSVNLVPDTWRQTR